LSIQNSLLDILLSLQGPEAENSNIEALNSKQIQKKKNKENPENREVSIIFLFEFFRRMRIRPRRIICFGFRY